MKQPPPPAKVVKAWKRNGPYYKQIYSFTVQTETGSPILGVCFDGKLYYPYHCRVFHQEGQPDFSAALKSVIAKLGFKRSVSEGIEKAARAMLDYLPDPWPAPVTALTSAQAAEPATP
jgi:hypothetical protein